MPKHAAHAAATTKRRPRVFLYVALFLVGAAIALYPAYSNLYNEYRNACEAAEYQRSVDMADAGAMDEALEAARAYNAAHTVNFIVDPFGDEGAEEVWDEEYEGLLNVTGDGVMGYIDIPCIGQEIVIYHGSGNEVLDKGVGHVQGTSLPVGGEGSHCVLAGHRGLPTAMLFTDLDMMAEGDEFYLHVLGDDLAYEVESVSVVEPEETSQLSVQPGRDLVTLVTCTPYAVNTHRLLVTGHRVPYVAPEQETGIATWLAGLSPMTVAIAAAMSVCVLVALTVFLMRLLRRDAK